MSHFNTKWKIIKKKVKKKYENYEINLMNFNTSSAKLFSGKHFNKK